MAGRFVRNAASSKLCGSKREVKLLRLDAGRNPGLRRAHPSFPGSHPSAGFTRPPVRVYNPLLAHEVGGYEMRVVQVCAALIVSIFGLMAGPASAQQTGALVGKVVDTNGGVLPGVTVTASSSVLPTPRVTTTGAQGEYRLPALPPGNYTVRFELQGMQTVTRQALVQLQVEQVADATLGVGGVSETIEVTAATTLVDPNAATIKSAVSNEQIMALPVGQEYRDLIKLIPGVQYTEDAVRGPSAGGSGQDNVYQFDGANVTMPLFGTLASEPASHDIAQVTTIKGGARAIDFDRSGGITIDSASKSGTNR